MRLRNHTIKTKLIIIFSIAAVCLFFVISHFVFASPNDIDVPEFLMGIAGISGLTFFFLMMLYLFANPAIKMENWINKLSGLPTSSEGLASNTDIARMFNFLMTHLKEVSEREYAATLLQKQAEFSELQSQINPHFLYNTLESIRSEALMIDAYEIAEMTESLASFFRYSIGRSNTLVTLEDEIENVLTYFKIQQFRFENRFSLNVIYDDPKDSAFTHRLPRLTLQPIVENAIRHGLEKRIDSGKIVLRISLTPDLLIINIQDNGVGMKASTLQQVREKLYSPSQPTSFTAEERPSGNGIALSNVHQRIRLLFGDVYGLSVMSTLNIGTTVEVLLPRITKQDRLFGPNQD